MRINKFHPLIWYCTSHVRYSASLREDSEGMKGIGGGSGGRHERPLQCCHSPSHSSQSLLLFSPCLLQHSTVQDSTAQHSCQHYLLRFCLKFLILLPCPPLHSLSFLRLTCSAAALRSSDPLHRIRQCGLRCCC
jgi:hypothetical protein